MGKLDEILDNLACASHFLVDDKCIYCDDIKLKSLISDQVAKAKYDIAEEMGKMMEIQGVNGTWNYDPYMHGMYNGMEFCHALVKGVEPKYRKAPKQWLADIPMPKNAKPTQTYPKRSKQ